MHMEPLEIGTAIFFPLLFYWIYWRWSHRRMLQLASSVPGPPAIPILGNALIFMSNPEEQLKIIGELIQNYGHYVKFWLGPDLNIIVKNPKDIRLLLTSNKVNQKGPLYEFMAPFIGRGILTGGPSWRIYRKIVTPSYNKKSVQVFGTIFNKEAEDLAKVLRNKDPNKIFNVYYDVLHCTTQSVCQTLMGLSKQDSLNVTAMKELTLETQSMYTLIFAKMTRWWLHIPILYWMTDSKKKENNFIKMIEDMTSDIIDKRRKALENDTLDEDAMGIVDRFIMEGLSEQEIKYETFSLFTTSQEASAKIASGVLLFLAHLPDWQEKVYNEIKHNLGPNDEVTNDLFKKLHNLDMVYKEVLRYMSIAAMIQRTVEEEITIDNGKITLPAKTSLVIPIHEVHRDPQYWDEPLKVKPERFSPENVNKRDPNAFIPFSLGSMDCLGKITLPAKTSLVIPIHEVHRDPQYWDEPLKVKPERFSPENVNKRDPNAFIPFSLGSMDCLGRVYATSLIKTLVVKVIREVQLEADGRLEDLDLHVAISVKFAKGYNLRARKRTETKISNQ